MTNFNNGICSLTAARLIRPIQAVLLSIAQECVWDASLAAAVLAALGFDPAVPLIRLILTLRLAITHLGCRDAHLPMGALKLTWGGVQRNYDYLNYIVSSKFSLTEQCTGNCHFHLFYFSF